MNIRNSKEILLRKIDGRPIVIWGARMTGIGFARFAKKYNLNVVSYIDSDPAFTGMHIGSIPINQTNSMDDLKKKYSNLVVVLAVALKEDEILCTLKNLGFKKDDFINYRKYVNLFYTIDIVGTCNLKCPSCAWSMDEIHNVKGTMSLDNFKAVTNKMVKETELITHVSFYSWGEPFLHHKLDVFINYMHELDIAVALSSNLSIKSSEQIRKVVKASPDYLKISLSGYYPAVYNSTHTGGDINLVKSNMYKLKYYIDQYKSDTFVDVNYHLYKNNIGKDLEMMKELCSELGFALSTTYALVMPLERVIDHCDGNADEQTNELSKLLLVDIDEGREVTKNFKSQPCPFLNNQINISWDCSVPLCCVTFDRKTSDISNNYLNDSLSDISVKKEKHSLCTKCIGYGLPVYNLGLNQDGWHDVANKKIAQLSKV